MHKLLVMCVLKGLCGVQSDAPVDIGKWERAFHVRKQHGIRSLRPLTYAPNPWSAEWDAGAHKS
jgi:hypothetical protein